MGELLLVAAAQSRHPHVLDCIASRHSTSITFLFLLFFPSEEKKVFDTLFSKLVVLVAACWGRLILLVRRRVLPVHLQPSLARSSPCQYFPLSHLKLESL